MKANERKRKEIGLAVVGSGTIGKIRAVLARDYPGVGWLGVCDINEKSRQEACRGCEGGFLDNRLQGAAQTKGGKCDHHLHR